MKIFRFLIPLVIIFASLLVAKRWVDNKPEAKRWASPPATTFVDATRVSSGDYQVIIRSQGTVKARTESTLIPEIAGVVTKVSPSFLDGGFFEEGELLLQIDPSNYETALTVAQASFTDAESTFEEEKALADQALADWKRLGRTNAANPLTLRKPQLAKAQAALGSAQARVTEAERNLKRTTIHAPYAGRILTKRVDIGQYVSPGTVLANIYAVDFAEIRLPLSNRQLAHVDVPEVFRGVGTVGQGPKVELRADIGGETVKWEGSIVRSEGAVDTRSRQQFVIAQVDNPYARRGPDQPPLKVGMFVEASIIGTKLDNVFVIPRSALRPNDEVLTVDDENRLHRKQVGIVWRDKENVIVNQGLEAGTVLCQTSLPFAAENALVVPRIDGEEARYMDGQKPSARGKGKGKGKGGPPGGAKGGPPTDAKGGQPGGQKKSDWKGKKGKS
ncbi:MAG: efflux RND transporter periplasmic adaptor subunit [Limisphaerales bacterium]